MSKRHREAFMRGFAGSFVLAALIITAIPKAIIEFVRADHNGHNHIADNHQ